MKRKKNKNQIIKMVTLAKLKLDNKETKFKPNYNNGKLIIKVMTLPNNNINNNNNKMKSKNTI